MKVSLKYEAAFAVLSIICVTVFFVSAAITADLRGNGIADRDALLPSAVPSHVHQESAAYVLREREGRVYVYTAGEPFMLTDINPAALPSVDRDKLRQGIAAADKEELLSLIEDFGS